MAGWRWTVTAALFHLSKSCPKTRHRMWKTAESPVPGGGLEPPRAEARRIFESGASTNSTIPANTEKRV